LEEPVKATYRERRDKREEEELDSTGAIADMGRGFKSNDCYYLVP
jgi:hypothetical protein